jgi:hypothetical protein
MAPNDAEYRVASAFRTSMCSADLAIHGTK